MSAKPRKPADTAASETIIAYKAFGPDWKCLGFQYEVGATYTHDGEVVACQSGFHACENPLDMLNYYPLIGSNFAVVEQGGVIARHEEDSKVASSVITIKAKLDIPDIIKASIEWISKKAAATSGNYAHSATSGDYANSATSGCGAHSATSGYRAHSATSGCGANSVTSGYGANSATSGYGANSVTSGDSAHSATSGYRAHSATSGDSANSATSGYRANAEAKGKNSVAASCGGGYAKAGASGAIFLVERDDNLNILAVFAAKVGENGIKPDTWYALRGGKAVEVTL